MSNILTPDLLPFLAEENREWLETTILTVCLYNRKVWESLRPAVCVHYDPVKAAHGLVQRDFSDPADNAVFQAISLHWARCQAADPQSMFRLTCPVYLKAMVVENKWLTSDDLQKAVDRAKSLVGPEQQQTAAGYSETVERVFAHWLKDTRVKRMSARIAYGDQSSTSILASMEQIRTSTSVVAAQKYMVRFGADDDKIDDIKPRLPYYLSSMTTALAGGQAIGEAALCIAPQGGGKSVDACQTATHWGYHLQKKGVVIHTEQTGNDYIARMVANLCNIPAKEIRDGVRLNRLNAAQKAAYLEVKEVLSKNMLIVDWVLGGLSIRANLQDVIRRARDELAGAEWVLFDWLGKGLGNLDAKAMEQKRHLYQDAADWFCDLAKIEQFAGKFYGQANLTQSFNKPFVRQDMIAECKSLGNNATIVYGISALREGNDPQAAKPIFLYEQTLSYEKARGAEPRPIQVLRDFGYQRFKEVT